MARSGIALAAILAWAAFSATGVFAAPVYGDDCDTGIDAPNRYESAGFTRPHICSGVVGNDDKYDWYRYEKTSGFGFEFRGDSGVTFCYFIGTFGECGRGYFSRAGASNDREISVQLSGAGRYNISMVIGGKQAPVVEQFDCTPSPSIPGENLTCTINALDDSAGVRYTVDWGDGTVTVVPGPARYAWENRPQVVRHAYALSGEYARTLTVSDVPNSGSPQVTTKTAFSHVQSSDGATHTQASYRLGAGDVGCPFGTDGCAVVHAVRGETSVHLRIADDLGQVVGALACATRDCDGGSLSFCGEGVLPLTGDDADVWVQFDGAFGPIDCGTRLGVAWEGTLHAAFR